MPRPKRSLLVLEVILLVALVAGAAVYLTVVRTEPGASTKAARLAGTGRTFSTNGVLKRACELPKNYLVRIWRGHDPQTSEDVTIVPQAPNYSGSFGITSHSGPWNYVQRIPMVLYGPKRIKAQGTIKRFASMTDVYPTVGLMTHTHLQPRDGIGRPFTEAIKPGVKGVPRLVMVIVWDGVGRNVLERWPHAWPNLKKIEHGGTSYLNTFDGSSPSITPATHSTLGTGAFPKEHGVTAITVRNAKGQVTSAFAGKDPAELRVSTFADQIDQAYSNKSKVGLLAWKAWHMGMLGHGSEIAGGDKDQLALIGGETGTVVGNNAYYTTPPNLTDTPDLTQRQKEVDRADGKADGKWLGHPMSLHANPSWVQYEADLELKMLKQGGYGRDKIPDIFLTNYKMTDIAGHQYTMDSPEEQGVLKAQDAALGRILAYLRKNVRDYVVVLTADHGHTPKASTTGAWPVLQGELQKDIDAHFNTPKGKSLIRLTSAVGPFLNRQVMDEMHVSAMQIAKFLNGYTIADNWGQGNLPAGYQDRGNEDVLSAAFPGTLLPKIMQCAFGRKTPPPGYKA
jgi:hypothetical protein